MVQVGQMVNHTGGGRDTVLAQRIALCFGDSSRGVTTNEYNGSAWTNGGELNYAR